MKLFGLLAILLLGVLGLARGSSFPSTCAADECTMESLPKDILDELEIYDKKVYKEPACLGAPPLPVGCNFMGICEDCRSCFMTCDMANKCLKDTLLEMEEWAAITSAFPDAYINFCPDAEVDSMEECPTISI